MAKRMNIFLSYHHIDEAFAKDFTNWLKDTFKKTMQIFSTSHPMSVKPGQLFNEIVAAASCADMIFLLIGPDSIDYRWMLFEAGITAGRYHTVVPIIFGGVTVDDVKMPLREYRMYRLDEKERFNALFASEEFPDEKPSDSYASFLEHNPEGYPKKKLYKELYIKYGSSYKFYIDRINKFSEITPEKDEYELNNIGPTISEKYREREPNKHEIYVYPLINGDSKRLVSVRLTIRPIRCEGEVTWKAGVAFDRERTFGGTNHIFALHSGDHQGLSSWSLYRKESEKIYCPINIPAKLDFEAEHSINIWIDQDRNELLAYGIDSDRNRYLFTINGRERVWTPPNLAEAKWMQIHAWIDDEVNQEFRVKITRELDYC